MTKAGYITDRRCPAIPEHGDVMGMRGGGYYCPHADHSSGKIDKSFWHEDEFEAAKNQPAPTDTTKPVAIPASKVKRK